MKIHPILVAVAGAALAACARPGTQTTEDTAARTAEAHDQALVRIVHAIPEAPPADVFTGDQKAFSNVSFGQATAYKPVSDEPFKITLKAAGSEAAPVIVTAQEDVKAGDRYTILAMPDRDGAAKLDAFSDERAEPPAGKALVRVIHAAPEVGSANVYSAARVEDPEVEDVGYGAPARYEEMAPGEATVSIEPLGQSARTKAAAVLSRVNVEPGKAYTLVVAPPDAPGKPAQLIRIEDPVAASANTGDAATGKQPAIVRGEGDGKLE